MSILGNVVLLIIIVLAVLFLLGSGVLNVLWSGAVSNVGGLLNPTVTVSGYAKTSLATAPVSITFGYSTNTVAPDGYYSITLDNDKIYSVMITYQGLAGTRTCYAGSLDLMATSNTYEFNATC